ncbi:MAG: hypothetical protein JW838_11435 [Spirochaetes bacterium]|nr:hypothetical protein [Spirochaetota bacterium]
MAPERNDNPSFQDYRELWNYNLQKMERIQHAVENALTDLEKKYADFEPLYDEIMGQLDILSSIYSAFNTVEGGEYVLKLRAVLESYRKQYTREGLDFNLVQRLLEKISDTRNASFEEFPGLAHGETPTVVEGIDDHPEELLLRKFRWITFERNRSWFIAPFRSIEILRHPPFTLLRVEEPDILHVRVGNKVVGIRDLLARSLDDPVPPRFFILLDNGERNYVANRIGRRIFADHDFISLLVRPFKSAPPNPLSSGRVRLFGKKHLLLRHTREFPGDVGEAGSVITDCP